MGMRTKGLWLLMAALMVSGTSASVFASEGESTYVNGALHKLGRGIANIATCPAELIRTPELVGRRDGYVAALSTGIVQGVFRTVVRGVAGVWEVLTFYAEIPPGFRPLITPEFVYAHGDWVE